MGDEDMTFIEMGVEIITSLFNFLKGLFNGFKEESEGE